MHYLIIEFHIKFISLIFILWGAADWFVGVYYEVMLSAVGVHFPSTNWYARASKRIYRSKVYGNARGRCETFKLWLRSRIARLNYVGHKSHSVCVCVDGGCCASPSKCRDNRAKRCVAGASKRMRWWFCSGWRRHAFASANRFGAAWDSFGCCFSCRRSKENETNFGAVDVRVKQYMRFKLAESWVKMLFDLWVSIK